MPRRNLPPDMTVVDALCRGVHPLPASTYADRKAAIEHLARNGYSDGQIGTRIGRSARTVLRVRTEHGIRGLPVGTNGLTMPRRK